MKEGNNLSYVTKLGAYGLAVVATFAVALAVLVSVSSTPTAEAQATGVSAVAGQTVTVTFTIADEDRFRIDADSEGSATFAENDSTAIRCADAAACDTTAGEGIGLRVTVDDDSPLGEIYVQKISRSNTGMVSVQQEVIITVGRANPPTALSLVGKVTPAAISEDGTEAATITVKATNSAGIGVGEVTLTVTTSRGALATDGSGNCSDDAATATSPKGACEVKTSDGTDDKGAAAIRVFGNGASGTATVSFLNAANDLTLTADVVIYGDPKNVDASVQQSSIAIGGTTFIVVTITDSHGNPVVGASADVNIADRKTGGIVSPGTPPVKVGVSPGADYIHSDSKKSLPACGDFTEDDTATEVNEAMRFAAGTNVAGKCVLEVTAGDAPKASRGEHTITVKAAEVKATVDIVIAVGGKPAIIETDAPEGSVEPLSTTKITVTVFDDENVRVGAVAVSINQVEGEGKVLSGVGDSMTSDGTKTLTYLAPSGDDTAVFYVTAGSGAGKIDSTIVVTIAEAVEEVVEPPPPPPSLSEAPSATGVTLTSFSGGTVEELKTALTAACSGDGVSAYTTSGGAWNTFIPGAPAQLNAPFSELYAAGIPEGKILLVANCGG